MKKKKIICIIILLLSLPVAFSLTEGQSIAQDQVDVLNAKAESLACQNESVITDFASQTVQVYASCLSVEKNDLTGSLDVKRDVQAVLSVSFGEILEKLAETGNIQDTMLFFQKKAIDNFVAFKNDIRKNIASLQSNKDIDTITQGLRIPDEKLNQ